MNTTYKNPNEHRLSMKFNILLVFAILFSLSFISAVQTAERIPATVDQVYYLSQTCATCSYANITIFNKDGIAASNAEMTWNGSTWIYEFTPDTLGRHDVNGIYDMNSIDDSFGFFFEVTPSGDSNQTTFFIIIIALIYVVSFIGFFARNPTITLIGGMGMMILGLYLIMNGITIYRDWITNAIGMFTVAIGAYISIEAGIGLME